MYGAELILRIERLLNGSDVYGVEVAYRVAHGRKTNFLKYGVSPSKFFFFVKITIITTCLTSISHRR